MIEAIVMAIASAGLKPGLSNKNSSHITGKSFVLQKNIKKVA